MEGESEERRDERECKSEWVSQHMRKQTRYRKIKGEESAHGRAACLTDVGLYLLLHYDIASRPFPHAQIPVRYSNSNTELLRYVCPFLYIS